MTHHTDAERADYEEFVAQEASRCGGYAYLQSMLEKDERGNYTSHFIQHDWIVWQAARRATVVPEAIEQRAKKLKGLQVLIGATAGVREAIELARSRFTEAYGRSPLHDDLAYACLLIDAYGRAPAEPVPQGLREAAQAVVERWDTPLWKDVPATAVYIADLRAALAAAPQPPEARDHTT